MKSNRFVKGIVGLTLFFSILITFIWFFSSADSSKSNELTFEQAISKIRKKEVKEVLLKQDEVIITDKSKNKFYTSLDLSDESREALLKAADESETTINLEPASSGYHWLMLMSVMPFIMWGITLAVIVYAVKVLSRNKS